MTYSVAKVPATGLIARKHATMFVVQDETGRTALTFKTRKHADQWAVRLTQEAAR